MAIKKLDAMVFGFPRCGSTSLWYYLYNHPDCHEVDKELHYWSQPPKNTRTLEEYLANFESDKVCVDVSPYTVHWWFDGEGRKRVIERILEYNPDIKLICLLRNPIDRTISEYYKDAEQFLRKKAKMSEKDFAVKMEGKLAKQFLVDGHFPKFEDFVLSGALPPQMVRSLYGFHLKKWVELAGNQILFVKLEDMRKGGEHLKRICDFLGIGFYNQNLPKLQHFAHMKNERMHPDSAPLEYHEEPWIKHATKHLGGHEKYPRAPQNIRDILWKPLHKQMLLLKELTGVDYDTGEIPILPELDRESDA